VVGLATGIGLTAGLTAIAAGAAVAGVGVSAYEASQSGGEASTAEGLAKTTAGEQQYYNTMLMNLINNPSSVSQLPGFQFELQTGSAAVDAQMRAAGAGGSGNEGAALTEFGQGLAGQFYQQQTGLLASLSGVTAASSPAQDVGAATAATGQQTNTLSSLLNSLGFFSMLGSKAAGTGAPSGTPASSGVPTEVQSPGLLSLAGAFGQ
jgi:hypothetical protein